MVWSDFDLRPDQTGKFWSQTRPDQIRRISNQKVLLVMNRGNISPILTSLVSIESGLSPLSIDTRLVKFGQIFPGFMGKKLFDLKCALFGRVWSKTRIFQFGPVLDQTTATLVFINFRYLAIEDKIEGRHKRFILIHKFLCM